MKSIRTFWNVPEPVRMPQMKKYPVPLQPSRDVLVKQDLFLGKIRDITRVLQKVLSLGSDYFSATFYQTYFYYKTSKYSPFTKTHFCNLFTQSRKADE